MAVKHKLRDTDFLYATAYIRSVEDKGLSRALVMRMLEAADAASCEGILFEARSALGDAGARDADALCDAFVNASFSTVAEITSNPGVFDFLRYQYDCGNVKTAVKCRAKGVGTDGLLFDCGTVPPEAYTKMADENDFSLLPPELAEAAKSASDAYSRTGDPQSIDLPLDLACLAAMKRAAEETGDAYMKGAVVLKIDLINVMTVLRVLRMNTTTRAELLTRALSPLGSISADTLIENSDEGEEAFISAIKDKLPKAFGDRLSAGVRLSEAERMADDAYLQYVRSAANDVFGASVPFLYLTDREYNAKNARIILAGKRAGLSYDEIRLRVRGL